MPPFHSQFKHCSSPSVSYMLFFSLKKHFSNTLLWDMGAKQAEIPPASGHNHPQFVPFHSCRSFILWSSPSLVPLTGSLQRSLAPSWAFGLLCTLTPYHLPPILFSPRRPYSTFFFSCIFKHRVALICTIPPIKAEIPSSVTSVSLKRVRWIIATFSFICSSAFCLAIWPFFCACVLPFPLFLCRLN